MTKNACLGIIFKQILVLQWSLITADALLTHIGDVDRLAAEGRKQGSKTEEQEKERLAVKRIHDVAENDGDCVDDEQQGSFFKSLEVSKGVGVGMLLRGKVDTN